MNTRAAKF